MPVNYEKTQQLRKTTIKFTFYGMKSYVARKRIKILHD